MTPRILEKILKWRRGGSDNEDRPRDGLPTAIGISDSTCEVNGDTFNGWKLPIPAPEERVRKSPTRPMSSQQGSLFFKLPEEVRRMIYLELMGNRRVHIQYGFKFQSPFRPLTKRKGKRWEWWHCICQQSNDFPEGDFDHDDWAEEQVLARQPGLTSPAPGTKIQGVEWLRCCQLAYLDSISVLYGTNVFVPANGIDSIFTISRLLPPTCAQLIHSIDFKFYHYHGLVGLPMEETWEVVYPAFFDLFEHFFCSVHSLRLAIELPAWQDVKPEMANIQIDKIVLPWEHLAKSRDWKKLEFRVPFDWYSVLSERAKAQNIWKLSETGWYDKSVYPSPGCVYWTQH